MWNDAGFDQGRVDMVKTEILYGVHPVLEAIRASYRQFDEIYVSQKESGRLGEIEDLAQKAGIRVKKVDSAKLQSIAKTGMHQGVAARTGPYPYAELDQVLKSGKSGRIFLLLLDHIVDPQNLGALIRTALCAGVDGMIIPKDRSAGPTPAVSKASAGALEHMRLCRATNLTAVIKTLKAQGVWIIGLDKGAGRSVFETDLTDSMGIVIGGEDQGIGPLIKKNCDVLASIPQTGWFNSLNASAAGAVVMYETFRQRIAVCKNGLQS
jgi:23S rRNA (guanosine2251-2'-O)-methyltransferase